MARTAYQLICDILDSTEVEAENLEITKSNLEKQGHLTSEEREALEKVSASIVVSAEAMKAEMTKLGKFYRTADGRKLQDQPLSLGQSDT